MASTKIGSFPHGAFIRLLPIVPCVPIVLCVALGCERDAAPEAAAQSAEAPALRGYVMARWHDEIPHEDPGECPDGLNTTEVEYFPEQWKAYMAERQRVREAEGRFIRWDHPLLPPDACQDPLAQPDPGYLTLDGPAKVAGLDLDGIASTSRGQGEGEGDVEAGANACAHDDFTSPTGEPGIDNQAWRLMGCVRGYRPNDLMDRLHQANTMIKEGGYAILMEISGMDDPRDDDAVEVQLLSAAAPVTLDAVGEPMEQVSFTAHADPTYHSAWARGRIEGGILTTDPVDLRLKIKQQTQDNAVYLRDARIRAEVDADGRIEGIVGGYWDSENFWSMMNDHTIGGTPQGRNAAFNRGFMCAGLHHAIPRVADGHPDPETGRCTSISTALHFEARPAFVIRPQLAAVDRAGE
ncbi:MAG: hypothetical protein IPK00_04995 [Deltaproteobacteria bacterium]|nr:hypothetical protein [Deltaproteobacteria bacterium]